MTKIKSSDIMFNQEKLIRYPLVRMRRLRTSQVLRDMVQESSITVNDLVYPVFVLDGINREEPIASMPGQSRLSCDLLLRKVEQSIKLGVKAIALFPVIEHGKDLYGTESYNSNGLIPRVIRSLKQAFPEVIVCSDVALDPYTEHGQDGIIDDNGYVLNDQTVAILAKQSLCHAEAGADFVCPSDMMDGRIGAIRQALDQEKFVNVGINAYSAKYASNFYGPFRQAIGSAKNLKGADKYSYQMNPANSDEALCEVLLDIQEGADIIMIKPGLPYLDIVHRIKQDFNKPIAVYQVSGEYSMLKFASQHGAIDYKRALYESMLCFKRAGADIIWSYAALDVAEILLDCNS